MIFQLVAIRRSICFAAALGVCVMTSGGVSAQQFLGKARQACTGFVTIATPQEPVSIPPFQALKVNVGGNEINISCQGGPPLTIECPSTTNEVLIDRTQGANVYSIVCLRN